MLASEAGVRRTGHTARNYWRPEVMRRKIVLLSMFVLFLTAWSGAQSTRGAAPSSANNGSSSIAPTEQQEMRDELRALRAEVERLRAEVEQQKSATPVSDTRANDASGVAPVPIGPGPNVPSVTASNFTGSSAV